jgi:hypothetical protein
MAFGSRKTATAVIKPDRQIITWHTQCSVLSWYFWCSPFHCIVYKFMIIPVSPLSINEHMSIDSPEDFSLKCIKHFFCSLRHCPLPADLPQDGPY